jgi:hypothetical protein
MLNHPLSHLLPGRGSAAKRQISAGMHLVGNPYKPGVFAVSLFNFIPVCKVEVQSESIRAGKKPVVALRKTGMHPLASMK